MDVHDFVTERVLGGLMPALVRHLASSRDTQSRDLIEEVIGHIEASIHNGVFGMREMEAAYRLRAASEAVGYDSYDSLMRNHIGKAGAAVSADLVKGYFY